MPFFLPADCRFSQSNTLAKRTKQVQLLSYQAIPRNNQLIKQNKTNKKQYVIKYLKLGLAIADIAK